MTSVNSCTPPPSSSTISRWCEEFSAALNSSHLPAALSLFSPSQCYWRDLVCFTWNIYTAENISEISDLLVNCVFANNQHKFIWKAENCSETKVHQEKHSGEMITEGWISFENNIVRGEGYIRLRGSECWTLLTSIKELKGFEEKAGMNRIQGVEHGIKVGRKTWKENRDEEFQSVGTTIRPFVVIIGGGQCGICLGARLKLLNVPYIIIDKNERAGDSWRNRYKNTTIHTPISFGHLPYIPFPKHWPNFLQKDQLADWYEMYTKVMELNYWNNTKCIKAEYNERKEEWRIELIRDSSAVTVYAAHLVIATGNAGYPNIPQVNGKELFRGDILHSSEYKGPDQYKGKKCVVIGSNNSAHDICQSLYESGAGHVTMVQRSATTIARSDTLVDLFWNKLYPEDVAGLAEGYNTEKYDLLSASWPYKLLKPIHYDICQQMKQRDKEYYKRLEDAGFMLDFGEDDTGLFMKVLRTASGYYIDIGATELVAERKIQLKSRVEMERITENGILFNDGSLIEADLIVFATGYKSMNRFVADLIGEEVAKKVGKCYGLGSNTYRDPGPWVREQRNLWKPTLQEGLWFHAGNLAHNRIYSKYLALQLKARLEKIPIQVYKVPDTYHKE